MGPSPTHAIHRMQKTNFLQGVAKEGISFSYSHKSITIRRKKSFPSPL